MDPTVQEYFRCPEEYARILTSKAGAKGHRSGYFRFGADTCFGIGAGISTASTVDVTLEDSLPRVTIDGDTCVLPFDLASVITNLRRERYLAAVPSGQPWKRVVRSAYYLARPYLGVPVRRHAQRLWLRGWDRKLFPRWPVDFTVDRILRKSMQLMLQASGVARIPFIWFWPDGKSSCAILTHDVEEARGLKFCPTLMDLDDSVGLKSSFQLIPAARYTVSPGDLRSFRNRGFEVNIHDLEHDGSLFQDETRFADCAKRINGYAARFGSRGFRSGVLYRNSDWYKAFTFSYDMSIPNVAHLEPQAGGCCTVMPFYIGSILELPLTTLQDYSLFHILGTYSTDLWREQIAMIREYHGLMTFSIHPDYLNSRRALRAYQELLTMLAALRSEAGVWIPLPCEVDAWWRQRSRLRLVSDGSQWRIEGPGAERARIAYAKGDGVSFEVS
jgi:hypothetical protein